MRYAPIVFVDAVHVTLAGRRLMRYADIARAGAAAALCHAFDMMPAPLHYFFAAAVPCRRFRCRHAAG